MVTVSAWGALLAGGCDATAGAGAAEDTSEATEDETGGDDADIADTLDDTADDERAEEAVERAGAFAQPDTIKSVSTANSIRILIFFIDCNNSQALRNRPKK